MWAASLEVASVTVPQLFEVERYPTVLQMTSTVQAQTDKSLTDIMTALFPCASITGAPKVRTMQADRRVGDDAARRVYRVHRLPHAAARSAIQRCHSHRDD